jgi:hypothetical protein
MPTPKQIVDDAARQYSAWVAAKKPAAKRGGWYGARTLGSPAGATNLKATEFNAARSAMAAAGWTVSDSRSGELSWKKGGFIYHALKPA